MLGPERLGRRPVVDEHDLHCGQYLDGEGKPVEIEIRAVLTGLSAEAEKRFFRHLRRWNEEQRAFADEGDTGPEAGDAPGTVWALRRSYKIDYSGVLKRPEMGRIPLKSLVGAGRFELPTPCAQGRCATRLRYAPTIAASLILD